MHKNKGEMWAKAKKIKNLKNLKKSTKEKIVKNIPLNYNNKEVLRMVLNHLEQRVWPTKNNKDHRLQKENMYKRHA